MHFIKINSLLSYDNLWDNRFIILQKNRNKSGIYIWINKKNNKFYIGSSNNISARLNCYFSKLYLENAIISNKSLIYKALLEEDYSSFELKILEYCEEQIILKREQYYIDLYSPEYNISKVAGSRLGVRHREDSILKITLHNGKRLGVQVLNKETNLVIKYSSFRAAAKALQTNHVTIRRYINNKKLFKSIYLITII